MWVVWLDVAVVATSEARRAAPVWVGGAIFFLMASIWLRRKARSLGTAKAKDYRARSAGLVFVSLLMLARVILDV